MLFNDKPRDGKKDHNFRSLRLNNPIFDIFYLDENFKVRMTPISGIIQNQPNLIADDSQLIQELENKIQFLQKEFSDEDIAKHLEHSRKRDMITVLK